jgi:hypothetical protein
VTLLKGQRVAYCARRLGNDGCAGAWCAIDFRAPFLCSYATYHLRERIASESIRNQNPKWLWEFD